MRRRSKLSYRPLGELNPLYATQKVEAQPQSSTSKVEVKAEQRLPRTEKILKANRATTMTTNVTVQIPPKTGETWMQSVKDAIGENGVLLYEGTLGLQASAPTEVDGGTPPLPLRVALIADLRMEGAEIEPDPEVMEDWASVHALDAENLAIFSPNVLSLQIKSLAMYEPSWLNSLVATEMDKIHRLTQFFATQNLEDQIQESKESSQVSEDVQDIPEAEDKPPQIRSKDSDAETQTKGEPSKVSSERVSAAVKETVKMFQQSGIPTQFLKEKPTTKKATKSAPKGKQ